jgi:hypothetical protein
MFHVGDTDGRANRTWQRRALETTDGHDQTEYNRILKGVYLPGKPGKAFVDMAPWPYLPTMIDTGKEGEEPRPTHPDKDLRRVRNGQLGIHPELTSKAWDTFNSNKARGIRNPYSMWHGQIKVRAERRPIVTISSTIVEPSPALHDCVVGWRDRAQSSWVRRIYA